VHYIKHNHYFGHLSSVTSYNKTAELMTMVMLATFIVVRNVLLECIFLAQRLLLGSAGWGGGGHVLSSHAGT